jgi:hypothetical protein
MPWWLIARFVAPGFLAQFLDARSARITRGNDKKKSEQIGDATCSGC